MKNTEIAKIQLIHKEPGEECLEVVKTCIVEDAKLKEYIIDKDTLLQNLPEKIVNDFLDLLGTDPRHRNIMLSLIKKGSLIITCTEDDL